MQDKIDNVTRQIKTIRSQIEFLDIKNMLTKMKTAFDGLITRLEERIIVLSMTVEITQTEMQRQNTI